MKYIIETNLTDKTFGAFVPGLECRTVGIEELKGFYYWPSDVFYVFMLICKHVIPDFIVYKNKRNGTEAHLLCNNGIHFLEFMKVDDSKAEESGKEEFSHSKWIDRLRQDKKEGKNYLTYK